MTPQEYQEQGYKISSHISQEQIDQAEEEVTFAYIIPSVGGELPEVMTDVQRNALIAFSFLRLSQNNLYITRAGSKSKNVQESNNVALEQGMQEQVRRCHFYLSVLQKQENISNAPISDICGIYFKTNFFND